MPLLTLYRPNFCAECGAKILRLRWFLWTSRKFCDSCARTSLNRLTTAGLLTSSIFVTGIIVGHNLKTPPPPLIIQRKETVAGSSSTNSPAEPRPVTLEEIYTCGARTKKGKPCSRRVHGPVRCWQHKGEKAMLPQEKLRVQE